MGKFIKDGDFMSYNGKNVIVRLNYEGGKQQGMICCEYTNEMGMRNWSGQTPAISVDIYEKQLANSKIVKHAKIEHSIV